MSWIHQCKDNTDVISLYPAKGLFLKPIARINISVHYPELKQSLTTGGKSVSSWDIMERIKALVCPETFISLRVMKNTLEFIRFEGDLENRTILKNIIARLDGKTMKVTGFKEPLKIRTGESKLPFPSKYDWDSFFRDAKNMNEMKAGERPDTIHFQNVPCKWFSDNPTHEKPLPNEKTFRRVWDMFGDVRCVDIPACDPYRPQMTRSIGGIKTFTFSNDNVFEAYVQYRDYMSFVKAMDALRGCFLFYQEGPMSATKFWVANLKVDFDRSKHLSDESIRRRKAERDKLMEKDKQKKVAEKLSKIEQEVKEKKKHEKEKKDTDKTLAKMEYKIAMEERKYLIAHRKLEAIRLMDYLFEAVKSRAKQKHEKADKQKEMKEKAKEENKKFEKVMEKYKHVQATEVEEKKERLKKIQSYVKVPIKSIDDRDDRGQDYRRESDSDHHLSEDRNRDRERKLSGGAYSSRYLGDWEVKAKSQRGSEVKVSANYVPVEAQASHQYENPPHPFPYPPGGGPFRFRGRGRGDFFRGRGRGRGGPSFPPYPHYQPYPHPPFHNHPNRQYEENRPIPRGSSHYHHRGGHNGAGPSGPPSDYYRPPTNDEGPGPSSRDYHHRSNSPQNDRPHNDEVVVRHNFSYLDELDRAYEKYFTSITKRHDEPSDRSPRENKS